MTGPSSRSARRRRSSGSILGSAIHRPSQCMVRLVHCPRRECRKCRKCPNGTHVEFTAFPAFPPTSLGPEPRVDDPAPRRPAGTLAGLGDFTEPPRLFEPVDQFLRLIGV